MDSKNQQKMVVAEGIENTLNDIVSKRNNNYLIVGASGTSKTRSIVIPNILKATGSYVISDPKGTLYGDYSKYLKEKGYDIYLLDFRNVNRSNKYNPLDYVYNEDDALRLAAILYERTNNTDKDKYWELSGIYLLASVISYVKLNLPSEFHNLKTVAEFISNRKIKIVFDSTCRKFVEEKYKETMTPDDYRQLVFAITRDKYDIEDITEYFKFLHKEAPCAATRFFSQLMNDNADNTKDCIFMEATFALQTYSTNDMIELTSKSDFKFTDIGKKKTAVFVTCSDTDRSKDSFVNLFYSQCLQELCNCADQECENHRLPIPVRFFLDDFATNFKIKDFDKIIAMIRSRNISANIIIQDLHQLKTAYGSAGQTIVSNCDNIVYLGGNDYETYVAMANQMDVTIKEIRDMEYRDCYVYRRLEESKKAKLINLELYKRAILTGGKYLVSEKPTKKEKAKVGFQIN